MFKNLIRVVFSLVLFNSSLSFAVPSKIYYSAQEQFSFVRNSSYDYWASLDGSNNERIDAVDSPTGERFIPKASAMAVDIKTNRLYWLDSNFLYSSNLDGTNVQKVLTVPTTHGPYSPSYSLLRFDDTNNIMYFSAQRWEGIPLIRYSLSDNNYELIPSDSVYLFDIDVEAQKLYRVQYSSSQRTKYISRSNMDGSNEEILASGIGLLPSLIVDGTNKQIIWSDNYSIYKSSLDFTSQQKLFDINVAKQPCWYLGDFVFNSATQTLFWFTSLCVDVNNEWTQVKAIYSAEINKPVIAKVRDLSYSPEAMALDVDTDTIYIAGGDAISVTDSKGSFIQEILTPQGLFNTSDVVSDAKNGYLFFADDRFSDAYGSIVRTDLNGKNQRIIFSGVTKDGDKPYISDLALDPVHRYIYFTSVHTAEIFRINYDGRNLKRLADFHSRGFYKLADIQFNKSDGKLYFAGQTDMGMGIYSCHPVLCAKFNPLAKNPRFGDIVVKPDVNVTGNIAIDGIRQRLYYTTKTSIERINIYGKSKPLSVAKDTNLPWGVYYDSKDKLLYWGDPDSESIKRSDINGNNIETVLTLKDDGYVANSITVVHSNKLKEFE